MGKIIRLSESDLNRVVKRVINEQGYTDKTGYHNPTVKSEVSKQAKVQQFISMLQKTFPYYRKPGTYLIENQTVYLDSIFGREGLVKCTFKNPNSNGPCDRPTNVRCWDSGYEFQQQCARSSEYELTLDEVMQKIKQYNIVPQ